MNHYTYIIEGLNKKYIGVRSCKCNPVLDIDYFGSSKYLNQAIQEHGKDKFTKNILAIFDTRKLAAEHEIRLHNHFDVGRSPLFWNHAKHTSIGFDVTGNRHTEETRRKMSKAQKGENNPMYGTQHTEEHKQRISKSLEGRPVSEETRQKMSITHTGKVMSDESRLKMSKSKQGKNHPNFGKHLSDKTRRKMSLAQKGVQRKPLSEDHKRKISESVRGENHPNFGKKRSAETIKKMSESLKGRIPWNKGKKISESLTSKFQESRKTLSI